MRTGIGRWALGFGLLTAACGIRSPIRQQLALDFNDPQNVRVTATTSIDDSLVTDSMKRRVAETRDALANARDEWAVRFAPLDPIAERNVVEKQNGAITKVERSITIPRAQLQRVFADTNITVDVSSSDGMTELAIYPGASTRATRQQKQQVESTLHAWSADAARYLTAMHHLYSYLDREPERAKYVFTRLLENEDAPVLEEEKALVDAVGDAADRIQERLRSAERDAVAIDEQFDRAFNPLPAEITVRIPAEASTVDGFDRSEQQYVIAHHGLVDALQALGGRWVDPDPLLLMQTRKEGDPELTGASLAAMPRHSSPPASPSEIEAAVTEQLKPANTYRLRWVDRQ